MAETFQYRYPEAPASGKINEPSPEFRKQVFAVLNSITVFILVYFLLVVAATGLAIACGYAGYWLITTIKNLWVILLGIGVAGVGVMVIAFLIKFIFKTKTIDRTRMREVTRHEHPMLFDFLQRVAKETQAPLPKRVYISNDVNAFVFYDSSFWSMFFPIRKNLNIGLGLVNCVNITEFKAIIAHEFGHFSQKSMKLGSYVYNVNHVIHDMLYDNDDYNSALESAGNVSNIFMFFANLTQVILDIIKEILEQQYKRINERFMSLSRQMEFDADQIAASVTGSKPLVGALYRLDFAQACFDGVLARYGQWIQSSQKGVNVFEHHTLSMKLLAEENAVSFENGLAQIDSNTVKRHRKNRVTIENQWASHPGIADREAHLLSLNIPAQTYHESAWTLFSNPRDLQEAVTNEIYSEVKFSEQPIPVDGQAFQNLLTEERQKHAFPAAYKGYYDNRIIGKFEPDEIAKTPARHDSFATVLNETTLSLQNNIHVLSSDIAVLERFAHEERRSREATFDFDGQKYKVKDASEILKKLKADEKNAKAALIDADVELFRLYYLMAARHGGEQDALNNYKKMFAENEESEKILAQLESMLGEAAKLYRPNVTEGMAQFVTKSMKKDGDQMKERIRAMVNDPGYASFYTESEQKVLMEFVNDNRKYYFNVGLDAEGIQLYTTALSIFGNSIALRNFTITREVLTEQLDEINDVPIAK